MIIFGLVSKALIASSTSFKNLSVSFLSVTECKLAPAITTPYEWIGYVGDWTITLSSLDRVARERWAIPSFEPMHVTISESWSNSTLYLLKYQSFIAKRSLGRPADWEYLCVTGFFTVSINLSTTVFGVGWSGLPIPKSIISSPRSRASCFRAFIWPKIYGGNFCAFEKSWFGITLWFQSY